MQKYIKQTSSHFILSLHNKNTSIFSFLLIANALLFSACGVKNSNEQAANNTTAPIENIVELTEAQYKNANIQLGKLEIKNISTVLKVNGVIDVPPQNLVSVSMPLGGYLKNTKLLPGMHISKGEVIATMEDQQYIQIQQEYLTIKNKVQLAESEYTRQKELNQSKATSDKVFQQTESEYKTLRIMLSALSEKLKLININPNTLSEDNISRTVYLRAPINGYVSKVNANIGKYVNPSEVLFDLINPSDIHLNLKVFEKDIEKLFIGQKLWAYNNNQMDQKHPCEIILISKDLSSDRSVEVHCHFKDYDKNLLPGMYMNADIDVKSANNQAITEDAIVNFEGKDFLFVANDNSHFEMILVELGDKENGFVAIKNSDKLVGKSIVTKGAYSLLMKMRNKEEE
jgi:cobalt-zinc-cadmium efflux system membrane fusion protein